MTKLLEKRRNKALPTTLVLPESWYKAAGFAKSKKKALEKHLKQIRSEWDNR
ncbi:hypothetical protein IPG41_07295 [Candidatus Peregrinibacteria bacterium]|nr:MAG: hypothetical protein IPG41_07295 [Candidatus Peregrinibacteria bacterium]